MSCRTEYAGVYAWRFCPDDPPPAADRMRAVMHARIVDETTGEPISVDIVTTSAVSGLTARSAPFGHVGLVGQPARVFPGLGVNAVELGLHVSAPGFLPLQLGGTLGPIAGFPDQFTALELGIAGLHRAAVALRGRTVQRAGLVPDIVSGASIELLGYWPVFPPADVAPPAVMLAPDLVHLEPGCYAPRADAVTSLRQRAVIALPGENKTLLLPAAPGARRLRLSDRSALAAGTLLVVDANDAGRRERIPLTQVDTGSSVDQPAWVTLEHPLAHLHPDGVLCQVGNPQAPGPANLLIRAAIAGDETACLDGRAGLASGDVVELDDGAAAPEYHELQLYQATSNADGYFRLPPVARVAMVLLHAQRAGLVSPDDLRVAPDYRVAENRITVTFP